ncbi:P-loop containing nucleoside triphosphate hydrolase protein [Ochromonadaceae sp. CCMP2298]|nr:P-loop containing nucleoside triphosphate hydrolase protein [Ochromonadaceae sp. CCMP2298]
MDYPEKTMFYCFLNACLTPLRVFKLGPFKHGMVTIEKAMKYAMKKTKLQDFGDLTFVDSYAQMMSTANFKSLKLTNMGQLIFGIELNMSMCRRLTFIQYLKDVPAVEKVPVPSPVFVMGLPRTGTTFLHRLLSLDPAVRAPLTWELLSPVPKYNGVYNAEAMVPDRQKRNRFVRKLISDRKKMGDHALEHIHEINADLPEECLLALSDEIPIHLSFLYSDYMEFGTFFKTIDYTRVVAAYSYYRKVLQLLSHQIGEGQAPRRWTLKCPIHIFYPKEIAAAFPDAKLIWTHRHPQSAVPSMCSLVKAVHQVYYEKDCKDDAALGRAICDISAEHLLKTPANIEASKLDCAHVIYNDLIRDPVSVVRAIYSQFGWEISPEYLQALNAYLEENRQQREAIKTKREKGGGEALHTYTAEEFSLTDKELESGKFAEYVAKFNVPASRG